MARPRLSVRSAKARDLAHRLARRKKRPIADIVERALEAYEIRETGRGPAAAFHALLSEVTRPVDAGTLRTTPAANFGPIDAANLKRAHAPIESGAERGKIVLAGFGEGGR